MIPKLVLATSEDAAELADLRNMVAEDLTTRHGQGPWSSACTERGVLFDLRQSMVYLARDPGRVIATLRLAAKKPWAIDRSYFTPVERPLYLLSMAVHPANQRQGIGRQCVAQALELARKWPAQSVCLDAYAAEGGAGDFYRKCGLREVGRTVYREVALVYFEALL